MGSDRRDELLADIYDDLRRRASRLVSHQGGAIAPTSLVHEALEKIYRVDPDRWQDSLHFKATAARAMRQVLVDRVRAANCQKRGGDWERVTLSQVGSLDGVIDAIALHHALLSLDEARPRAAEVARLRLLGGMELAEVATYLEISLSTVKREWRTAKAFVAAAVGVPG